MDIPQSLNYKITDYNTKLRKSRAFIPRPEGDRKPQEIIDGIIKGNRIFFEDVKDLQRDVNAMKDLGFSEKDIATIFDRRGLGSDYGMIKRNKYQPFGLSDNQIEAFIRNARENGYTNPVDRQTLKKINQILKRLYKLDLDEVFPNLGIELERSSGFTLPTSALPNMPMPNVNTVNTAQAVNPNTNLTRTETALLSPEEQVIASRT